MIKGYGAKRGPVYHCYAFAYFDGDARLPLFSIWMRDPPTFVQYNDLEHVRLYRSFLENPESYINRL